LVQREDSGAWCLPGGAIEAGETLAQAAVREAREETGLEVRLTRLVGVYSRPRWQQGGSHDVVFAGEVAGGALVTATPESLDARFFPPEALPADLLWWERRPIADALAGAAGVACAQGIVWPFAPGVTRRDIYAMRDRGELSRRDLRALFCRPPAAGEATVEVPGVPGVPRPGQEPR
jgi:ADP-ribose pyrophosphatase YjhB (NUDIX family)